MFWAFRTPGFCDKLQTGVPSAFSRLLPAQPKSVTEILSRLSCWNRHRDGRPLESSLPHHTPQQPSPIGPSEVKSSMKLFVLMAC
jgi:hypothetical protein